MKSKKSEQWLLKRFAVVVRELIALGWNKDHLYGAILRVIDESEDRFKCDLCGQVFGVEKLVKIGMSESCNICAESVERSMLEGIKHEH